MARAWLGTEDGRRWHQRAADSAGLLKAVLRALSTRHGRDYLRGFAVAATSPGHPTMPVRSATTNGSANSSATGSANGAATGSANGAATGSANGAATGSANGSATGSANGAATGSANGAATGSANGVATGAKRSERLTVGLSEDEDLALKQFGMSDGVAAAARVRAMLLVYRTDPDYRRRVDEVIHAPV
ncbi:hypothetical protein AB0M47_13435 [Hamadaea sp. NPDC051192]|uniref:hypothetical protein n=1 Tax=Hamadaea sp. NPDC051192 TaxID=3154940 RepID=UPI0034489A09